MKKKTKKSTRNTINTKKNAYLTKIENLSSKTKGGEETNLFGQLCFHAYYYFFPFIILLVVYKKGVRTLISMLKVWDMQNREALW